VCTGQHRDRLAQLTIGRESAVQVGIHPQDVGQRHRVSMIGLRPCHRAAFPIPGHRQWVDRIHRPAGCPQRRNEQSAWGLDRHWNRVFGAIAGFGEQLDQLSEPAGVVGDTLLGDQPAAFVDDGDVAMRFGPINAAEQQCHV
jgi:hypothetical protein